MYYFCWFIAVCDTGRFPLISFSGDTLSQWAGKEVRADTNIIDNKKPEPLTLYHSVQDEKNLGWSSTLMNVPSVAFLKRSFSQENKSVSELLILSHRHCSCGNITMFSMFAVIWVLCNAFQTDSIHLPTCGVDGTASYSLFCATSSQLTASLTRFTHLRQRAGCEKRLHANAAHIL